MRDLVHHMISALERGRELIVCQVVETRGSTPQKAGAMMIIDPDGGQSGTLGGGCVENEVKQKAIQHIGEEFATVHTFVLDHDYAWADGLICGGKMVIITQSLRGPGSLDFWRALAAALEQGRGFVEAVVIDENQAGGGVAAGARFLFDGDGHLRSAWPPAAAMPGAIESQMIAPAERPKPSVHRGIAFLPNWPRIRLVVVGAGHVGQAVANLAAQVDFDVWIVDDRRQYANRERFPNAQRIIVGPIDEMLPKLEINRHTYALIVTRGHGHDQEALARLAPTPAAYVGLIGSRRKIRLIFENLRESGIADADLARVAAPVGIDIGSQTVAEIAVSIVAELIARRNLGSPTALAAQSTRDGAGSTVRPAASRVASPVASQP